ncbi:hypothetical protein NG798_10875 [Ancylothrix sp. C2]|uniref:hypothetical protein n=1 Tax=Ancylothrix sp. D3o TaxID=2953691 RepID=UPI0021BB3F08|nr:hypothetical protein [Ancylothrix sp. D3o]MCT7950292.1 hypothetical protein [Ancylothrix sp. D3o]
MQVKQSHYEELLAEYSNALSAISLLKQYRPYLELLPSMRRPDESIITIPLPVVRVRDAVVPPAVGGSAVSKQSVCLPCDIAILMCDPEWKVKLGAEILIFIHRRGEDFSDLLGRWRQTQVWLDQGYEWLMPLRHQHILSEEAENIYPLFVLFAETPERIKRGLKDAYLPFVVQSLDLPVEPELSEEIYSGQE